MRPATSSADPGFTQTAIGELNLTEILFGLSFVTLNPSMSADWRHSVFIH